MKTFKEFIALNENGGGLSRISQHIQDRNVGTITAHRGNLSAEENNKRNEQLKNDIKDHGYGYKHVKGHYIENYGSKDKENPERPVEEKSFLIIGKKGHDKGKLKDFLVKHGEKYDQDSVLHKPHDSTHGTLIGTNKTEWLDKGAEEDTGTFHPDRTGKFYSEHKGKNYKFESVEFYDAGFSKTFLNRAGGEPILIETYRYDESGNVIV